MSESVRYIIFYVEYEIDMNLIVEFGMAASFFLKKYINLWAFYKIFCNWNKNILLFQIQGEGVTTSTKKTLVKTTPARIPLTAATANGFPITATTAPFSSSAHVSLPAGPQYRGLIGTISTISRQEGPRALYNGLSAGLQRQMCFASVRLGLYDSVKAVYSGILNENPQGLQIFTRVLAGLSTGGMAVILAQPTDVVKVRFQAQRKEVGSSAKPRYKSTFAAYRTIGRTEGMPGLWKGAMPNIGRNAVVNVSEIVCYDIVKECLLNYAKMKDNIILHFTSACIAGNLLLHIRLNKIYFFYERIIKDKKNQNKNKIILHRFRNHCDSIPHWRSQDSLHEFPEGAILRCHRLCYSNAPTGGFKRFLQRVSAVPCINIISPIFSPFYLNFAN